MKTNGHPFLTIGDQVRWVGFLEMIMTGRVGVVVEVLLDSNFGDQFVAYRIRQNDGTEGIYYGSQLERTTPPARPNPPQHPHSSP